MRVDVIHAIYWNAGFILVLVENTQVLLAAVEVQATDRLAVVVIKQDTTVALVIADGHTLYVNSMAHNGLNNHEAFDLFFSRDNLLTSFSFRLSRTESGLFGLDG
ncbi:hypothetical protein D3C85_1296430 [compost metagenome]